MRHASAVARLSRMVGMRLGLDELELEHLRLAALLHDAGSLRLPFPHVGSRWDLPAEERRVWETHPWHGARMAGMLGLSRDVAAVILGHHERWDGSGYPRGLKGEEIPVSGRICAIADVFDALTTHRSYKELISDDSALQMIQESSGVLFDPGLVDQFTSKFDEILKIKNAVGW